MSEKGLPAIKSVVLQVPCVSLQVFLLLQLLLLLHALEESDEKSTSSCRGAVVPMKRRITISFGGEFVSFLHRSEGSDEKLYSCVNIGL